MAHFVLFRQPFYFDMKVVVCLFVRCLFVPSLSSCHEKAMVALLFGRIRTRLGVVHFRVSSCFLDFLPPNFLLVRSHQAKIIIVKHLIQGLNNVCDEDELNLDHVIVITRSP